MALVVLLILVLLVGALIFAFSFVNSKGSKNTIDLTALKNNAAVEKIISDAEKKLSKNPHDAAALTLLADIYYQQKKWETAYRTYETLCELQKQNHSIDGYEVNYRRGEAAEELGMIQEAFLAYASASSAKPQEWKAMYKVGSIEFKRGNYKKAVAHLVKARGLNAESAATLSLLGHANFKLKQYKEAMVNIRHALEIAPGDKEALFTLAVCYAESGQSDQALRVFSRLRGDPEWGAESCAASGAIHIASFRLDDAITDLEIGLKHKDIKQQVFLDLNYKLASALLKKNEMAKALKYLKQIQANTPDYKDTDALVAKYTELCANENLGIYIMSMQAEFLALCKKIVNTFYKNAQVKITSLDIEGNDWADVFAEISTTRWQDIIGFRFIRTQGTIGDFVLRDFHVKLREQKAGKGICFGLGEFSAEAKRFTEARLIDLVERSRAVSILASMNAPEVVTPISDTDAL